MQSLHPLPQVIPTMTSHLSHHNMSSTTASILTQGEFTVSTTTLVNNPFELSPHTPPPRSPPLRSNDPPTDHLSCSPPTPTPKKARSSCASTTMATLYPPRVCSMSFKHISSLTPGHCTPSPLASPTWPLAAPSSILRPEMRLHSSVRSSLTSAPRCHANLMPNAPTALKKTMDASPTSPSLMQKASCIKHATSNWAMAWSLLHSTPWARMVTPSSSMIYSPPSHTITMPPLSHSPCGSSMPPRGRHLPTTRPWIWHKAQTTGGWSPNSPITTSQILGCSTSWPKYTRSTVSCRLSRQPVIRATAILREPALTIVSKAFKPSTLAVPLMPMCMSSDFTSAVVGCWSRWRVMTSLPFGTRGHRVMH